MWSCDLIKLESISLLSCPVPVLVRSFRYVPTTRDKVKPVEVPPMTMTSHKVTGGWLGGCWSWQPPRPGWTRPILPVSLICLSSWVGPQPWQWLDLTCRMQAGGSYWGWQDIWLTHWKPNNNIFNLSPLQQKFWLHVIPGPVMYVVSSENSNNFLSNNSPGPAYYFKGLKPAFPDTF